MDKYISVPVISLLFVFCCSMRDETAGHNMNQKQKNDWKVMNLKGQIRFIRESKYAAVVKNEEVQQGERKDSTITIFNNKGNKIEVQGYRADGRLNWKSIYKYIGDENKIEMIGYKPDGSPESKQTFMYDKTGNVIELKSYKQDGSLYWKTIYTNDSNGNIIEENRFKPNGSFDWRYTWKYDDNEYLIETSWYQSNDSIPDKYFYKNDRNGNPIERCCYKRDGSIKVKYTYNYDYDKKQNWTKSIELENEKRMLILKREIEYF